MAWRARRVTRHIAGYAAAALVAGLCLGTIATILASRNVALAASDWAAIRFTLAQAALSCALSVLAAIPLARALARRRLPLRPLLVLVMGAPFILPVIVAALGMVAVFGRNGWISDALAVVGLPPVEIYGLGGVVMAHVFFNLPLAVRMILQGWVSIPAEQFRMAQILGFTPGDVQKHLEVPMLRQVVPGALALIFLICTTSFAVALLLGGGPAATTVELAIYQAFRFDFDLPHAAGLALVQVVIGLGASILAFAVAASVRAEGGLDRPRALAAPPDRALAAQDGAVLVLGFLFLLAPLAAIVVAGVGGLGDLTSSVLAAMLRSLAVAGAATVLALALALPMAWLAAAGPRIGARMAEAIAYLTLAVSPLVVGTGLFLVLYHFADPVPLALAVTALVNAVLALPFALQSLLPGLRRIEAEHGRLADHLGLTGARRWLHVILPRLRRPLGFAAGLAAALSIGDLGVIALFADPASPTLPLYVHQLMGAYRSDAAAGAALILMVVSLAVFWLFDRGGRINAEA